MDLLKRETKQAYLWLLGLTIFIILVCAADISTHDVYAREYLAGVAFGSMAGAIAGAVLGYTSRLCLSGVHAMAACFSAGTRMVQTETEDSSKR